MSEFELSCCSRDAALELHSESSRLKPSTAELDMFTVSNRVEPGRTEPYVFRKAPADDVAAMLTSASLVGHHI